MDKKAKLKELYFNGINIQSQLDAITMSSGFLTSKELGAFYLAKAEVEARAEINRSEFEKLVEAIKDE